jgi:tetratricopeptide (TPR) repeat protein
MMGRTSNKEISSVACRETPAVPAPPTSQQTVFPPSDTSEKVSPKVPVPPCPPGYEILEKLGSGGMGEVWKARDIKLGRCVAIKYLRAVASDDDLARFKREAETASRLNHPGVTSIHAVGQEEGRSYIVMQLVNGRTLAMWPPEDQRGLVRIVRDTARAVDHAHKHGVLHRDIKPSNILLEELSEPNQTERAVLVTDFGLARWLVDSSQLTETGQVVGTPAYMPPEQVRGEETGRRGDVYSLGATLYELLKGHAPFTGENALQILRKVVEEEPAPLLGELGAVVAKAMEKDPVRRYGTAAEFAEDLDRWLSQQPVRAPKRGVFLRFRRGLARRKLLAIAGVAVLLGAAGLRAWTSVPTGGRRASAHEAARARVSELLLAWVTSQSQRENLCNQVIQELDAALESDRHQPQAWIWLGRCRRLLGRDASSCWEEALRIAPDHREALRERSRHRLVLYARLRGMDFGRFGPVRAESAEEALLLKAAADDRDAAHRAGDPEPMEEFIAGFDALRRTDGTAAEAAFSRYLELVAWDGMGYALRAQARRAQRKYPEAEADGSRAVELSPHDPWVAFLRGSVFQDQSRLNAAERDYARSLELDPAWGPAYAARGALYADNRMAEKAEPDLRRALDLNPGDSSSFARLGDVLVEQQRLTEAEAIYTKAIHGDSHCAAAWRGRGRLFRAGNRFPQAEEDFTRAIAEDPSHARTYEERGNLRRDLLRPAEAIQDWRKAGDLDPLLQAALARHIETATKSIAK